MQCDALTIAALCHEFEGLVGGSIQRLVVVDALTIVLEVYIGRREQLLLSASADMPLVMLQQVKARRGVETPTSFSLLAAKYVRGARVTGIRQIPNERIVHLSLLSPQGAVTLICELMGRYSNIILVDEHGTVMDAIKRIPPSLNRYRVTLPHQPYVPPLSQAKLEPQLLSADALAPLSERRGTPLWRALVDAVTATSPLLAREAVFRAVGSIEADASELAGSETAVAEVLQGLLMLPSTRAWQPSVALDEFETVIAFASYQLTHLNAVETMPSMHAAVQRYLTGGESGDGYLAVRRYLQERLNEQIERVRSRQANLERRLIPESEIAAQQTNANAILAMAWQIEPGQRELILSPEMAASLLGSDGEQPFTIPLDPALSANENAQHMFAQVRRKQAANARVPELLERVAADLGYLEQLGADIALAESRPELDLVGQQISAFEAPTKLLPRKASTRAVLTVSGRRHVILVGRSSLQNELVTFRMAASDDMWLHAHGVPGAHVIIRCGRAEPDGDDLQLAANLAAWYSTNRGLARVLVDYTRRKHVTHMPGGRAGMVNYRREQTLVASGEAPPLS
ncbi:MAG: fibronectin/fibrinogen-binding protein [Chloroflexi bacterium]|nr:fibronectin/fibrinogen-binding protein [Chloroflexota bacterium]